MTYVAALSVLLERIAVRIYIKGGKDKSVSEILIEVKKAILEAYTVRLLRSGDVDVMVLD